MTWITNNFDNCKNILKNVYEHDIKTITNATVFCKRICCDKSKQTSLQVSNFLSADNEIEILTTSCQGLVIYFHDADNNKKDLIIDEQDFYSEIFNYC